MKKETKEEIESLERKLTDNTHRNGITFGGMTSGTPLTEEERSEFQARITELENKEI